MWSTDKYLVLVLVGGLIHTIPLLGFEKSNSTFVADANCLATLEYSLVEIQGAWGRNPDQWTVAAVLTESIRYTNCTNIWRYLS